MTEAKCGLPMCKLRVVGEDLKPWYWRPNTMIPVSITSGHNILFLYKWITFRIVENCFFLNLVTNSWIDEIGLLKSFQGSVKYRSPWNRHHYRAAMCSAIHSLQFYFNKWFPVLNPYWFLSGPKSTHHVIFCVNAFIISRFTDWRTDFHDPEIRMP